MIFVKSNEHSNLTFIVAISKYARFMVMIMVILYCYHHGGKYYTILYEENILKIQI